MAKPQRIKEGSTRPVWAEDAWLQEHAGETLENDKENNESDTTTTTENQSSSEMVAFFFFFYI